MYSLITSGMTWSYSRITTFENCPYKFFLTYIKPHEQAPMFFSDYGSFLHEVIEKFCSGQLTRQQLPAYYLQHFLSRVQGKAPDAKIFQNYFRQGFAYLQNIRLPDGDVVAVEHRADFSVGGFSCTGVIDLLLRDSTTGEIILCDHKARALKQRSTRTRPTKTDQELDRYLRQLYLYSVPCEQLTGKPPDQLILNCYRSNELICEPFSPKTRQSVLAWAAATIRQIIEAKDFPPCLDFYHCKYLCGVHHHCEYYEMQFDRQSNK